MATTSLRIPEDLLARLQKEAERQHRSINGQILIYVERGLEEDADGR